MNKLVLTDNFKLYKMKPIIVFHVFMIIQSDLKASQPKCQ